LESACGAFTKQTCPEISFEEVFELERTKIKKLEFFIFDINKFIKFNGVSTKSFTNS
jgi:hypothetical protein